MTFKEAYERHSRGELPMADWGLSASQCRSFIIAMGGVIARAMS